MRVLKGLSSVDSWFKKTTWTSGFVSLLFMIILPSQAFGILTGLLMVFLELRLHLSSLNYSIDESPVNYKQVKVLNVATVEC